MTVEDLIEELRWLPATADIGVQIRKNVVSGKGEDTLEDLYELREVSIETVLYTRGLVIIQLDE